ncbi:uncharacterized protein LOC111412571 [Olea europaea var. sylvestris]|uniref:uncharacterized protein LOC111412571 n=1 Tax=Olea europaea var. sylvestris TaxID=158386 RepID=UPI000C1D861C|nr:uncharacterized protein LOC111412571 [Olea europaea var. sylvestris]
MESQSFGSSTTPIAIEKKHFAHISKRTEMATLALKEAQVALHDDLLNVDFQRSVACMRRKAMDLCEAERSFYYKKAKCEYLKNSDKCTKFFHSMVKRNAKKKSIAMVRKDDEAFTSSMVDEFLQLYKDSLGKNSPREPIDIDIWRSGSMLSEEQSLALIWDVFEQEIKDALFSIGMINIQDWMIIHLASSKNLGVLLVITNVLASRLGHTLDTIIDEAQAAFMKGRSIMENIHLAQELLMQYNRKRVAPRCLLKIDLRMAYHLVDWNFMKRVFKGLEFPTKFIGWVMKCITTATYSIAINGSLLGFIKGRRALC